MTIEHNEASPLDANSSSVDLMIEASIANCINYGSWQNSVPLLRSLEIRNISGETASQLRLDLETSPGFIRKKSWIIEQIGPGETLAVRDRDVELDPGYLNGLNEAERGVATLRLYQADKLRGVSSHEIRVLARDEWGGMDSMGELLAAYVMPNDPAISKLLKSAGDTLAKNGHSPALDGYQSRDPRRAYMLVAALWSVIAAESLTYANPPRSFEQLGQKTRRPATIIGEGLATCLDSTLLFAAAIEAIGLNPVVIMTEGHCFAGVWLVEKTLSQLIECDCGEIRKAIAAKELVTFETTLVASRPPARFDNAVQTSLVATRESEEGKFVAAIDIARARMAQIRPLASHDSTTLDADLNDSNEPMPLPDLPSFDSVAGDETEEKPTTASGRIDRWQRKLLDLSLNNRLLNYKSSKQTIPIICPNLSLLEDRLAAGAKLRLISLPDQNPIGARDAELHHRKTNQELDVEFARQATDRDEIACPIVASDLISRLTALYRKVRNDLSEGGSNTLYLAVGFLKWKRPNEAKSYRAPLLLVPVKLVRNSAVSPYHLMHHEDDVRFNATLIQLLKKDFDRDISTFEASLPKDASGVDVPRVLERMRREVRDIAGFEVVEEIALSNFSFAKYLMWKDLVDRVEQLATNRVVRHLIHNPDKPFESASKSTIPHAQEIDKRFAPKDLIHPLPADSTQLTAMMAASEDQDFVLVGPPGTGKSQTIANIITQCLATGKTVLFVAEKTAALDVVHRRLRQHGLADCCLELHSNRAERRKFLDQLDSSWQNNRRPSANDWIIVSDRLRIRRDELNSYVAAIHAKHHNGWTVFRALGVATKGSQLEAPTLAWPESLKHDEAAHEELTRLIAEMALTFEAVDPAVKLNKIKASEWTLAWETKLLAKCGQLKSAASALHISLAKFGMAIGLPNKLDCSLPDFDALCRLSRALVVCAGDDVRILFHKQFGSFPEAVENLDRSISRYREANQNASGRFTVASISQVPVDELDRQWKLAAASYWPMSWLARRRLTRLLQSYAMNGKANPTTDIQLIRSMQQQLAAVSQNPLAGQTKRWNMLETDTAALLAHIKRAGELRQAIVSVGQPSNATNKISKSLYPALAGDSVAPIFELSKSFIQAFEQFVISAREFGELAGAFPFDKTTLAAATDAISTAEQIQSHRTHLQRWTSWCNLKKRSKVVGLTPFVSALEAGRVNPSELADLFQLAFARWWLPKEIDRSPVLRGFQRFKHEDAIRDFRKLDDLARTTASARAREAVAHELPAPDGVPRQSELGLLRHQIGLKRPSKSIREMIEGMPESFGKLAPCLLMSPLSIAQYLPVNQRLFDVVVFDEASQITTWDAIGAIARGRQTVIVGDPKQLPPTNFFGRSESDENDDELEDHEKDLESILDEAQASGLPTLQLNWHYRSRHESLIAFSNWHYYKTLITFPAADSEDLGVSFIHLPNSVYDRGKGKSQTNAIEAAAIVQNAVDRMKKCLAQPEKDRLTFGVITFNSQQQSLIENLFDKARENDPELEWYFSDDRIEPTAVKNLENVQGDERDVMYFSITFGPNMTGKIPLTFGPLNRDGGERRLNVAVTRARRQLIVYSSFKGSQLDADRSKARGVHDLKNFLEYAEKGPIAMAAQTKGSVGGYDSPFEESVAESLIAKGWQVVPQVGVSGLRVDLGIVHPDKPGAYLAGVECDGATYHRSAVARDRDKTRQQVLENLGWNIIRVWSPDWWYDPVSALQRVDEAINGLLTIHRQQFAPVVSESTESVASESDSKCESSENVDEAAPATS